MKTLIWLLSFLSNLTGHVEKKDAEHLILSPTFRRQVDRGVMWYLRGIVFFFIMFALNQITHPYFIIFVLFWLL